MRLGQSGYTAHMLSCDIIYLRFSDTNTQNRLLGRLGAYYENPDLGGTFIPEKALYDWNLAHTGSPAPWAGFNIPRAAHDDFSRVHGGKLTKEELELSRLLQAAGDWRYLISTTKDGRGEGRVFFHEISHALFAIDAWYRERATAAVRSSHDLSGIMTILRAKNYAEHVLTDEAAAYLLSPFWFARWYPQVLGRPLAVSHEAPREILISAMEKVLSTFSVWPEIAPAFYQKDLWDKKDSLFLSLEEFRHALGA